jgi:phage gpG-like protein
MNPQSNFNFTELQAKFNRIMQTIPAQLGTVMVNFSKQRFREQNWIDATASPWASRKAGARRNRGRALLIDSGRLRRSIRIITANRTQVTIGTDVPYAEAHNEGSNEVVSVRAFRRAKMQKQKLYSIKTHKAHLGKVNVGSSDVKAHTRKMNMPQRRFIGESVQLNNQIRRHIETELNKLFK